MALAGLPRYIATPETSKHRIFEFFPADIAPDNSLIVVATANAFHLGVLSSAVHGMWALAAGSRLGIDGTPRYNKGSCFEAFPFPDASPALRTRIADVSERIDAHRKAALARSAAVGMTSMYNAVDRLRAGRHATFRGRAHRSHARGVRDAPRFARRTRRVVAEAYGWSWPQPPAVVLERLIALHDARVAEEQRGTVRWPRPAFQASRFADPAPVGAATFAFPNPVPMPTARPPWPGTVIEQIAALKALADGVPISVDTAAAHFTGTRRDLVARHLDTLALMGELTLTADGRYSALAVAV